MFAETKNSSAPATVQGGRARRGMIRSALTALTIAAGLVLVAPSASAAAALPGGFDSQLLSLVNSARANAGLGSLQHSSGLAGTASYWSNQLASGATGGALQHYSGAGSAAAKVGARAWGENVGKWTANGVSASDLFNSYMASPSHKANILGGNWKYVGIVSAVSAESFGFNTMEFADTVAGAQAPAAPAAAPAAAAPKAAPAAAPAAAPKAAAVAPKAAAVAPKAAQTVQKATAAAAPKAAVKAPAVAPAAVAPVAPAAPVAVLTPAQTDKWLDALYRAALGRPADTDAKALGQYAIAGGASLNSVAAPLLATEEAAKASVTRAYTTAFGQAPDQAGQQQVDALVAAKASSVDVWTALYSSPQAFAALGGSDTETWVRAVAAKIQGTQADAATVASWTTLAALGGRESAARGMLFSLSGRAHAMSASFLQYLARDVDAQSLATRVSSVFGAQDGQLALALATSTEFVERTTR